MKILLAHLCANVAWCFIGYRWFKYGGGSYGPSGQRFVIMLVLATFLFLVAGQSTIPWYRSAVHDLFTFSRIDPVGLIMRFPAHVDRHSGRKLIAVPGSCRSLFRSMSITSG
jgi:hypothetical protein